MFQLCEDYTQTAVFARRLAPIRVNLGETNNEVKTNQWNIHKTRMNAEVPVRSPKNFLGKAVLSSAEYAANGSQTPPAFHRLLSAGGLTAGLWIGRSIMDVVTARNSATGKKIDHEKVFWPLRGLYGTMTYNAYSDDAGDRWKQVLDKMTPMALGAFGAWAASRHFFYGKGITNEPFHLATSGPNGLMARYKAASGNGKVTLEMADSMMMLAQAESQRKIAAVGMITGSPSGTHLFGSFLPFTNGGGIASTFQLANRARIDLPGPLKIFNGLAGNRGKGTRTVEGSLIDTVRWAESNLRKIGHPHQWMDEKTLVDHVKNITQNFAHVSPEQEKAISQTVQTLIHDAHTHAETLRVAGKTEKEISDALVKFMEGANPKGIGFKGEAYERLLIHTGFDLTKFEPGYGTFKFLSRHTGSANAEREIETHLAHHLKEAHGIEWGVSRLDETAHHRHLINGIAVAGIGTALLAGGLTANNIDKHLDKQRAQALAQAKAIPTVNSQTQHINETHEAHEKNQNPISRWINQKPLDVMQWVSNIMITPPSTYRLMNAAYFSAALWGGMQVANALTGRKLPLVKGNNSFASILKKEDAGILKSIHGIMEYTPGSVALKDRMRQAAHFLIPVSFGAVGTYIGNRMFFKDRAEKLKDPKTLEDYVDKISMEQAKPFGLLTAATSIFGAGSGLHLLPIFSYSGNLHNNYLLANGNQMALPGIGKWWSGNAGLTPWGIKRSLEQMTNHLAYNSTSRPKDMPALVHSVIGKLYPTMNEETLLIRKQEVLDRIYEIRDTYLENGVIPKAKQPTLHSAMAKLLSGEGLENLLMASDLDPLKANLANNGASGSIGNFLGAKKAVSHLENDYRQKFTERTAKANVSNSPNDYLRALADSRPDVMPAANDNQGKTTFAERIKGETPANPTLGA